MPSSGTTTRKTQEERRGEAEQALLDAAMRLFARHGVDGTSLADIGNEAGYSRGLANHHFGSRAALVERLAARSQQRFIDEDPAGSTAGIDRLLSVADAYLARLHEHVEESRAFFVMWGSSFAEHAQLRPVFVVDDAFFRDGIASVVRDGQDAGVVRSDVDAEAFGVVFVALLRGIGAQYFVAPTRVDLDAARRTCADLLRGVLVVEK